LDGIASILAKLYTQYNIMSLKTLYTINDSPATGDVSHKFTCRKWGMHGGNKFHAVFFYYTPFSEIFVVL
jgi:hypothetical protein